LGLFDAFDKGILSPNEFRKALRQHLPSPVSDAEIDAAWNTMLLDLPTERLDLLAELRQQYQLLLLSNTNEIHVTAFSAYLQQAHGFSDFSSHFDKWYYSCRMGMRKPDAVIFQHVLTENKLVAAETLFIDDSLQHVEGAVQVGIESIWLEKGRTIHDLKREGAF
jgi:putative hydrolase of the HAD superfamily